MRGWRKANTQDDNCNQQFGPKGTCSDTLSGSGQCPDPQAFHVCQGKMVGHSESHRCSCGKNS